MPTIPGPGRVVTSVGSLAHRVLSSGISVAASGLNVAQSVVDRIPGAERSDADASEIGSNPKRQYGSKGSRNLAR